MSMTNVAGRLGQRVRNRIDARWLERPLPGKFRVVDLLALAVPATSYLQIPIVGRVILAELIALILVPWLLMANDRVRAKRSILILLGLWLVSQILTDVVVHSVFADWARGWAGIVFTLIDLLAITALAGTATRIRLFAMGVAVGGLVGDIVAPNTFASADPWKWAIAFPAAYVLVAVLSGAGTSRRPWVPILAFSAFGIANALLQFRAMSGVAMLSAAYLLIGWMVRDQRAAKAAMLRPAIALASYGVAAVAVFVALNFAAASGLLGDSARTKYDAQAGVETPAPGASAQAVDPGGASAGPGPAASNEPGNPLGVIAGGRAEILSSTQAIRDSPIIGHGSWAKDPKYVELQRKGLLALNVPGGNAPTDPALIPTHSFLLGSWVWAGLAGGVFWLAVAILALAAIVRVFASRSPMAPAVVFLATLLLWNIAFSPYANTERLFASFAIVVCLFALEREPPRPMEALRGGIGL